jgi:hypothetical protein
VRLNASNFACFQLSIHGFSSSILSVTGRYNATKHHIRDCC